MPNALVIDSSMLAFDLADASPPCAFGRPDFEDKENIPPNVYRARKGGGGGGAPKRRAKGATTKRKAKAEAPAATSANVPTTRSNSAKALRPPESACSKAKFKVRGLPRTPARATHRARSPLAHRSLTAAPPAPPQPLAGVRPPSNISPPFEHAMQRHAQYAERAHVARERGASALARDAKEQTRLRDPATADAAIASLIGKARMM